MIKSYAEFVVKFRWLFLVSMILVVMLAGMGAKNLFFNNDYRIFFNENDPRLQAFESLQNTYSKNDNVLMVLAPKGGKVFSRETLAAIEDIETKEDNYVAAFKFVRAKSEWLVERVSIPEEPASAV